MSTQTRIAKATGRPDLRLVEETKTTICLRLTPSFLAEVDAFAKDRSQKRTVVVEEALRLYLTVMGAMPNVTNGRDDAAHE